MQSSYTLDQLDTRFDDTHAIANAGLLLPATLADVDLDLEVFLVLGEGRRERACPSATRPRWPWTAICVSTTITSMPTCPGYGPACAGG